jgi:hypothetical protein
MHIELTQHFSIGMRPLSSSLSLAPLMSSSNLQRDQLFLKVGTHTVFVETEFQLEDGSETTMTGTGFFVSENLVLTAAHVVVPQNGKVTAIGVKYKGIKDVKPTDPTIECQLLEVIPPMDPENYDPLEDLAIIKCRMRSPEFLRLSTEKPSTGDDVQIVGYPGNVDKDWLSSRHPSLKDPDSDIEVVKQLLPHRKLMVSEGKVSEIKDGCARHGVSTIPGMSGGCLLYQGQVCGKPTVI